MGCLGVSVFKCLSLAFGSGHDLRVWFVGSAPRSLPFPYSLAMCACALSFSKEIHLKKDVYNLMLTTHIAKSPSKIYSQEMCWWGCHLLESLLDMDGIKKIISILIEEKHSCLIFIVAFFLASSFVIFIQFYWDIINIQHCISLWYTA